MKQSDKTITIETTGELDVIDLSDRVASFVVASGIDRGLLTIIVPGSTASVTTIEFESGVVADLKRAIEEIAPRDRPYAHDARWGDGNGYSHVRAALLKPSLTVPIRGGAPAFGTWQQPILLDFDNCPRSRQLLLHCIGE